MMSNFALYSRLVQICDRETERKRDRETERIIKTDFSSLAFLTVAGGISACLLAERAVTILVLV